MTEKEIINALTGKILRVEMDGEPVLIKKVDTVAVMGGGKYFFPKDDKGINMEILDAQEMDELVTTGSCAFKFGVREVIVKIIKG